MRQAKVWRYWCDHCRKGGCGKGAMLRHEQHCTKNPQRSCRMCGVGGAERVAALIAVVTEGSSVDQLRDAADNCPACMLAAVVQARGPNKRNSEDDWPAGNFDYKAECREWWKTANEIREEDMSSISRHYG